ncbi:MAG: ribonuclease P protein component [Candidatus Pacebacteria bacterium]|nr:ribonuclease P protein component [Candidatus Paceibacterota bacterium]MBP9851115.1 ribonuclease P protein component [Candidatus Paceibacterota bacterium]
MLPKKNRATKQEIESLFKKGSVFSNPFFFLKYTKNEENKPKKVSFIVPKKVEKLANRRNSLKRMGYNAILPFFHKLPHGFEGVFTLKQKEVSKSNLQNEFEKIFNKIN